MGNQPLVSVVMPVYNAGPFVQRAISSILNQTYKNIEFIIIDDGSTDESVQVINSINDDRIVRVFFDEHKGIVDALNLGIDMAKGEFIARMDADDECILTRIEKQVTYLQNNLEIGMCGTQYMAIGGRRRALPVTHDEILSHLYNACPFWHPTVLFRTNLFKSLGLKYDKRFEFAEDLELWSRVCLVMKTANLPNKLIKYRFHEGTHLKHLPLVAELNKTIREKYIKQSHPELTDEVVKALSLLFNRHIKHQYSLDWFKQALVLVEKIRTSPTAPKHINQTLNNWLWFHLASEPKWYKTIKPLLKNYNWAQLSIKQRLWLSIKGYIN